MKIPSLYTYVVLLLLFSCKDNNAIKTDKIQKERDNITDISSKIVEIKPDILFGDSELYIIDNSLIVSEISPRGEKGIHLFDKKTFRYITSTGQLGKGPGEITRLGNLGIDKRKKSFWAPDRGKSVMYNFPLDSAIKNKMFKPTIKKELRKDLFIARLGFINDSIIIGKAVYWNSNSSFEMFMAKWNINNNMIEKFGYENPKAAGKNSNSLFAMSVENDFYVNCYDRIDLVTICDLEGNLRYNIYGPGWFDDKQGRNSYFFGVDLYRNNIIASYIGEKRLVVKGNISKGNSPSKFIIFDQKGNYLKTIETGFEFTRFCVDEENKRIIAYFETRENPLGYFDISFLDHN